ncbi:hypothetical protein [Burkholderia seminalis]|nr:hypothetical protein [Burkholderia seminalis]
MTRNTTTTPMKRRTFLALPAAAAAGMPGLALFPIALTAFIVIAS